MLPYLVLDRCGIRLIDNVCTFFALAQQLELPPAIIAKVKQSVKPEQHKLSSLLFPLSSLLCGEKEQCNEVIRAQCIGKGYVQLHV